MLLLLCSSVKAFVPAEKDLVPSPDIKYKYIGHGNWFMAESLKDRICIARMSRDRHFTICNPKYYNNEWWHYMCDYEFLKDNYTLDEKIIKEIF